MLSNVAGPQKAVSLDGQVVEDMCFYCFNAIGLYFGVLTYNGKVNAGCSIDVDCENDATQLMKHWAPTFEKLYAAVMSKDIKPPASGCVVS